MILRYLAPAATIVSSSFAFAADAAAKAPEAATSGGSAFSTLLIFGVLGGLGYLFYSVGLLPGGGAKSDH